MSGHEPGLLTKCVLSDNSHAFKARLSKSQVKRLKQAGQEELVAKLQVLSVARGGEQKGQQDWHC